MSEKTGLQCIIHKHVDFESQEQWLPHRPRSTVVLYALTITILLNFLFACAIWKNMPNSLKNNFGEPDRLQVTFIPCSQWIHKYGSLRLHSGMHFISAIQEVEPIPNTETSMTENQLRHFFSSYYVKVFFSNLDFEDFTEILQLTLCVRQLGIDPGNFFKEFFEHGFTISERKAWLNDALNSPTVGSFQEKVTECYRNFKTHTDYEQNGARETDEVPFCF
ncbi:uncharacterized protein LOC144744263 [Ciona intestinalis]